MGIFRDAVDDDAGVAVGMAAPASEAVEIAAIGPVIQWTESEPSKLAVAGSNPAGITISDVPTLADAVEAELARRRRLAGQVRGGRRGGRARAEKLTAARRSEIARNAANERWRR
jgi:hypothetical protein